MFRTSFVVLPLAHYEALTRRYAGAQSEAFGAKQMVSFGTVDFVVLGDTWYRV